MFPSKNIKHIIFDLGGVIININPELSVQAFKKLTPNSYDWATDFSKEPVFTELEVGQITEQEFSSQLLKYFPSHQHEDIVNAWNTLLLDIPKERIDLLIKLKDKYNLFLLSNTNIIHVKKIHQQLQRCFQLNDFTTLFKKVYYSHELKMRKPHPEIFLHVLEDNHIEASETLFIDDSLEHILSAQSLNIQTHHLNLTTETINTLFDED